MLRGLVGWEMCIKDWNISSLVGDLYEKNDSRRDTGNSSFNMGVNMGAMIAPLWCGWVSNGESPEGFKWSFLSAAIGMIIGGLIFYLFKNKYLGSISFYSGEIMLEEIISIIIFGKMVI